MPTKKKVQGDTLGSLRKEPPGVFRYTKHGIALRRALASLGQEQRITAFLEMWVMKVFDMKMTERLGQLGERLNLPVINFQAAGVKKHSLLDGGWEIHLENVQIHSEALFAQVKNLKILADNFESKSVEKSKNSKYQFKNKNNVDVANAPLAVMP